MFKLAIDPGHGGPDRGAQGYAVEAVANLLVAKELEAMLNESPWPVDTMMTRTKDDYKRKIKNPARGKLTNEWGADLVLSIHCNNFPNAQGLKTFYWQGNQYSYLIAQEIQRCAPRAVYRYNRHPVPIPDDGYPRVKHVLAPHRAPVVLVELGFVNHQNDAQALKSARRRREFVACLMMGVARALTLHLDN